MRVSNSVDFWRGYALVCIFVNHVPGIRFEHLTLRGLSISDSAELFVFFAGWAVRLASLKQLGTKACGPGKIWKRALELYGAHLACALGAIAMLALAAWRFDTPALLSWVHSSPIFEDPARGLAGIVLLSYQLQYFDILPLYIFLMLFVPLISWLDGKSQAALLGLSFSIYAFAAFSQWNIPFWPGEGHWFFDPLSWQIIFVLGFVTADNAGFGRLARETAARIRPLAMIVVCCGLVFSVARFVPDPVLTTGSLQAFLFNKTFLGLARLLQFFALIIVFAPIFTSIKMYSPTLANLGSLLGRNSLLVFCAGSFFSLAGQMLRFWLNNSVTADLAIALIGIPLLLVAAKVSEWQKSKNFVARRTQVSLSSS